ncbi:MAG: hypothetical protein ACPHIA_00015 [Alphaproteobacteria bacterium]
MATEQPGNRYVEAVQDFLKARTSLELLSLAAIVLLVIDLLIVHVRATTLVLIGIASLPWWLPYLKAYLQETDTPPAAKGEEMPDPPAAEEDYDDTDQYGA